MASLAQATCERWISSSERRRKRKELELTVRCETVLPFARVSCEELLLAIDGHCWRIREHNSLAQDVLFCDPQQTTETSMSFG